MPGFEPMVPGFTYVPYNDLDAVAGAIDPQTAAVLVEPIQGEGGINIPDSEYLPGLRRLCDENGILLILDEVQSGMGRTGKWFAYQHTEIEPDILTCAKALAGGIAAGVMMAQPQSPKSSSRGCTRPPSAATRSPAGPVSPPSRRSTRKSCWHVATLVGTRFREQFESLRAELPDLIRDIRVSGVMIGLDMTFHAADVVPKCMERRLLVNVTHEHVVRLLAGPVDHR